jgi:hypothetical protein
VEFFCKELDLKLARKYKNYVYRLIWVLKQVTMPIFKKFHDIHIHVGVIGRELPG